VLSQVGAPRLRKKYGGGATGSSWGTTKFKTASSVEEEADDDDDEDMAFGLFDDGPPPAPVLQAQSISNSQVRSPAYEI
jgi:hypothetical protein